MEPFVYEALSQRVVFGSGTLAQIGDEVRALKHSRAFVLSTPQQKRSADALSEALGPLSAGVFAEAAMHTPVEVTARAVKAARDAAADVLVSLGGGSTTGLGKAIALRTDLDQIVIPTSYAGSEATPILGQTENGKKTTQRARSILPEVIVYDVDLTITLPPAMSATSGMNAIAHAIEALYAENRNPLISQLALQGIAALAAALPKIIANSADREARSDALFGAWACGTCLGAVGMAIHHKLCHTLGGSFDLPHAETHTVILPHAVAYNEEAAAAQLAPVRAILGSDTVAGGLFDLARALGAPTALKDIGMNEADLARAAAIATENPYWNPRPIDREAIAALLDDAYHGRHPNAGADQANQRSRRSS